MNKLLQRREINFIVKEICLEKGPSLLITKDIHNNSS